MPFYAEDGTRERGPCNKRGCADCRPRWNRGALRKVVAGIPDDPSRVVYIVLTAPGVASLRTPGDVVEWNRAADLRAKRFVQEIRRHAARHGLPRPEYFATPELQARGVIHYNVLVRDMAGDEGDVQRWAIGVGFGEVAYYARARTRFGLAKYIGGYIVKARDVFPLGSRYYRRSQGWSLARPEGDSPPEDAAEGQSFAGPPPGLSWADWMDPSSEVRGMFFALRRYKRRRKVRDSVADFEERCSWMFAARSRERGGWRPN